MVCAGQRCQFLDQIAVRVVDGAAAQVALGAENIHRTAFCPGGLQVADFLDDGGRSEIVDGDLDAGGLGAIIHAHASAIAEHAPPEAGQTGDQPHRVYGVDAVVGQFAAAPVPEPVPVVVEVLATQRDFHRRGTGPEIVVHRGRHGIRARRADRGPWSVGADVSQLDLSELAFADVLRGGSVGAVGAELGAALADAVVLASGLHHAASFADVVTDRLLDVHILAGLHGPDGRQGVPVVRCGNRDDVHRLVVEDPPHVLDESGLALEPAGHSLANRGVCVANVADEAIVTRIESLGVRAASAPYPEHGHAQPLVGTLALSARLRTIQHGGRSGGCRSGGQQGLLQKQTTAEVPHSGSSSNGSDPEPPVAVGVTTNHAVSVTLIIVYSQDEA